MTRRFSQSTPQESGRAGDLARALLALLGPAWQAPDGSVSEAQFLAEGDALDAALDALDEAIAQAYPGEASSELAAWERVLYLPTDELQSTATRQAAALARVRGTLSGSPDDLLAAVQTLVPGASLREWDATEAAASGNARNVFTLRVSLGASYGDSETESKVTALLAAAKPAHVAIELAELVYDAIEAEDGSDLETELGSVLTEEF